VLILKEHGLFVDLSRSSRGRPKKSKSRVELFTRDGMDDAVMIDSADPFSAVIRAVVFVGGFRGHGGVAYYGRVSV
jgi:hypothetical protein